MEEIQSAEEMVFVYSLGLIFSIWEYLQNSNLYDFFTVSL